MIRARRVALRTAYHPWSAEFVLHRHFLRHASGTPPADTTTSRHGEEGSPKGTVKIRRQWNGHRDGHRGQDRSSVHSKPAPSLIEQLFPEETKQYEAQEKIAREIPRLPLDLPVVDNPTRPRPVQYIQHKSHAARRWEAVMESMEPGTAVLVLRNASKNLTEEDFRRLIPQGQHIEGWTLTEGDVQKVVPGRDLATLDQQNVYYILFSSALSAFTFQGHVSRLHSLAAAHTPQSTANTIPPPPGWMSEGLDVQAAIQSYTLVPPNQRLELRQLRPPLSPVMESIVRHEGYRALVCRKSKMPFEARLTMEGPQLQPSTIRHILMESGWQRGMSWSGGDNFELDITRWEPKTSIHPSNRTSKPDGLVANWYRDESSSELSASEKAAPEKEGDRQDLKRRTPQVVLIVGFHTERAAQSFVAHWHRRSLKAVKSTPGDDDLPPLANVQMLW